MSGGGSLDGRHALVTGAGRGIGAAVAAAFAGAGARVTLLGRDREALEGCRLRLGKEAHCVVADVTARSEVDCAFAAAESTFGPVEFLVNNAGQAHSAPFAATDEATLRRMLDVNLFGAFHCIHAVLPGMLGRRFGRIVNVASTAGLKGYPYVAAYAAAKHAVVGLTRVLALEVATKNVTVNAVCPGFTDTDIVRAAIDNIRLKTGRSEEAARAALTQYNPQQRLVLPEEVANAVLWLCCAGSDSVTGQSIAVAGGEVM